MTAVSAAATTPTTRRWLGDLLLGVALAALLAGLFVVTQFAARVGLERGWWLPSHPLPATAADPDWWLLPAAAIAIGLVCTLRRPRWWGAAALVMSAAAVVAFAAVGNETDGVRVVAQNGPVTVSYARATQRLRTVVNGEVVSERGPDCEGEPLLAAIAHSWLRAGDRVRCIGAPAVAQSLQQGGLAVVEDVLVWPGQDGVRFAGVLDGPVAPPNVRVRDFVTTSQFAALADLADGSRQMIAIAEWPTRATSHRATDSYQRELRRVVGGGLVLQAIPGDGGDVRCQRDLLQSARRVHPWNGIYSIGDAAVLVSGMAAPRWRARFGSWSDEARWACHRAHLGGPRDLELARQPSAVAAVAASGASLLGRWLRERERLLSVREQLQALGAGPGGRRVAHMLARPWQVSGARDAFLQAVRGLANGEERPGQQASLASRRAFAIDPGFFERAGPLFGSLPRPLQAAGDLEDLSRVQVGDRLARRCAGEGPLAVALRTRFASRCARSLVGQLALAPLPPEQRAALRELADPFVLDEIARVLAPAGRWPEVLDLWRADVPIAAALIELAAEGSAAERKLLAVSLIGRRDAGACRAIASLVTADDVDLLVLAAEALAIAGDGKISFDPGWPRSKRAVAADRLRGLHMRKP